MEALRKVVIDNLQCYWCMGRDRPIRARHIIEATAGDGSCLRIAEQWEKSPTPGATTRDRPIPQPSPGSDTASRRSHHDPQGSHRPAEVVAVQREIGHRLVDTPVLAEPIRLPRLPRVAAPVRRLLPLHERRVDRPAAHRRPRGPLHACWLPNTTRRSIATTRSCSRSSWTVAYASPGSRFTLGQERATAGSRRRLEDGLAEGRRDHRLVGRVFVAGHQRRGSIAQAALDLGDDLLDVLDDTRPGDHRQHQLVLGVVGEVVPPVPLVVIGRVGGVAVLLLLIDEGPLLVEPDLAGPEGEKATSSS